MVLSESLSHIQKQYNCLLGMPLAYSEIAGSSEVRKVLGVYGVKEMVVRSIYTCSLVPRSLSGLLY
jgi:hypothetical protein